MKLELALYHLLLDYGRALRQGFDPANRCVLDGIISTLTVYSTPEGFRLEWKRDDTSEDKFLLLDKKRFQFFVRGDTTAAIKRRGDRLNYREHNWREAGLVWREILNHLSVPDLVFASAGTFLGMTPPVPEVRREGRSFLFWNRMAIIVVAGGLVFGMTGDAWATLWSILAGALALVLMDGFSTSHLQEHLSRFEEMLIVVGAVTPGLLGAAAPLPGALLLPLLAFMWLEGRTFPLPWWLVPGSLCLFPLFLNLEAGRASALALLVAALIMHALLKSHLPRHAAAVFGVGAAIVLGVSLGVDVPWGNGVTTIDDGGGLVLMLLEWVAAGLLWIGFMGWWVHGVQRTLAPLTALLCLAAVVTTDAAGSFGGASLAGFVGLGGVTFLRVARAIKRSGVSCGDQVI
ncbi:MAG: hypothetical protein HQL84_02945 [Magnetococcales bacterium]|nr:hypothetical protein [Magnetococcales bacterium]MBF0148983.1 hypothetical protein [Magnetococcales bacterium]MBF0603049.1 hypothetical protein [Magnetococcales bacterium]